MCQEGRVVDEYWGREKRKRNEKDDGRRRSLSKKFRISLDRNEQEA